MTQKDKADSLDKEAAVAVDYAFWDVPGESFKVIYSLPLFHEIDFVVNEGYRKIPHGGIEVGGLLFGTITDDAVRIEAFREIECEHASGPSLNFSERDLAQLENQITVAASDPDLENLTAIGWFLAHTRGPLELTEAEAKQFDRFFPGPFHLTILIKPERFQPTRFGFLVRARDQRMPSDASNNAVILPLPGRSHKAGQLIPSLPAPAATNTAKRSLEPAVENDAAVERTRRRRPRVEAEDPEEDLADDSPAEPPRKLRPPQTMAGPNSPLSIWKIPPDSEPESEPGEEAAPAAEPFQTAAERAARKQLSRDRARIIEQAFPLPPTPPAPTSAATSVPVPFRPPPLPSLPANAAVPSAYDRYPRAAVDRQPEARVDIAESVLNPRSVTALALAALLGCLVGYIAYLQLPAPVIPIDVRPVNQTMVVSWPPDETRNSIYAAIRLNDGPPVPLSAEEKRAGQVSLTAAKDFKVEVMARNWIRDSRGVVRYLHSPNGNGQVIPSDSAAPIQ